MSVLAKNIKLIRQELGCTQLEMAEILKIGFRTYARYEGGHRDAPVSVLASLARFGNISLEQLLTQRINRYHISPVMQCSENRTFPKTKMVDFQKGKIVFKAPFRQELISIDSYERKLLILFRKMNIDYVSRLLISTRIQRTVDDYPTWFFHTRWRIDNEFILKIS